MGLASRDVDDDLVPSDDGMDCDGSGCEGSEDDGSGTGTGLSGKEDDDDTDSMKGFMCVSYPLFAPAFDLTTKLSLVCRDDSAITSDGGSDSGAASKDDQSEGARPVDDRSQESAPPSTQRSRNYRAPSTPQPHSGRANALDIAARAVVDTPSPSTPRTANARANVSLLSSPSSPSKQSATSTPKTRRTFGSMGKLRVNNDDTTDKVQLNDIEYLPPVEEPDVCEVTSPQLQDELLEDSYPSRPRLKCVHPYTLGM